ncbi:unnamed protein product [Gadus morhua 'NCC']
MSPWKTRFEVGRGPQLNPVLQVNRFLFPLPWRPPLLSVSHHLHDETQIFCCRPLMLMFSSQDRGATSIWELTRRTAPEKDQDQD